MPRRTGSRRTIADELDLSRRDQASQYLFAAETGSPVRGVNDPLPKSHRLVPTRAAASPAGRSESQPGLSRRPSANTCAHASMRTDFRNPVGQNGSPFTSASTASESAASTNHNPPAPEPSLAFRGPAARTELLCFSRNARCAGMCLPRWLTASGLSSNRTTNRMVASSVACSTACACKLAA